MRADICSAATHAPEVGVVTLQSQLRAGSQPAHRPHHRLAQRQACPRRWAASSRNACLPKGDMVKAGRPFDQIDPSSYRATWNEAAAALK